MRGSATMRVPSRIAWRIPASAVSMAARRESAVLKDILWFRCEVVFEGRVGSWCELELGREINATLKVNHHVTLSIVANIHFAVIISNNRKDIFHSIHHDEDKCSAKPILNKDLRHS